MARGELINKGKGFTMSTPSNAKICNLTLIAEYTPFLFFCAEFFCAATFCAAIILRKDYFAHQPCEEPKRMYFFVQQRQAHIRTPRELSAPDAIARHNAAINTCTPQRLQFIADSSTERRGRTHRQCTTSGAQRPQASRERMYFFAQYLSNSGISAHFFSFFATCAQKTPYGV